MRNECSHPCTNPVPCEYHLQTSRSVLNLQKYFYLYFLFYRRGSVSKLHTIFFLFAAETLTTADYAAIGTSLGITVLLLAFIGFFLWRAKNRGPVTTMGGEIGQVSLHSMPITWLFSCLLLHVWNLSIARSGVIKKRTHAAVANLHSLKLFTTVKPLLSVSLLRGHSLFNGQLSNSQKPVPLFTANLTSIKRSPLSSRPFRIPNWLIQVVFQLY